MGASEKGMREWGDTLKAKYACTDMSHLKLKRESGGVSQSGDFVECANPGTIFQCV